MVNYEKEKERKESMLRITSADYSMLLRFRQVLRENDLPQGLAEPAQEFCSYVDRLETEKQEDLRKHRENLQRWRNSPTGKEKNRIINNRSAKTFREKRKAEKAKEKEKEN